MFSLMPWRKERESSGRLAPRTERPLSLFRTGLDELFDRFFTRLPALFEESWLGGVGLDIEETPEAVLARMDAPGFETGDFDIQVTGDILKFNAERKVAAEGKEPTVERWLHREVTLPARVDLEKVEARYHSGVLELRLPKMEPTMTRKIEVKSA